MSTNEILDSLTLLEKDWEIDPIIREFILGKNTNVSDFTLKVKDVIFHIPYLPKEKKYILWKCYWPDCHNCCNRQGRLPLTSDDLIQIGVGLKYQKTSDFISKETLIATHDEPTPSGGLSVMTNINLKRKEDETEADDGTHISCRFLDNEGACGIHPERPGDVVLLPREGRETVLGDERVLFAAGSGGRHEVLHGGPRRTVSLGEMSEGGRGPRVAQEGPC